jgi:hypothetical protein
VILPKDRDPRFITIRRGGRSPTPTTSCSPCGPPRVRNTSCPCSSRRNLQTHGLAKRSRRLGHGGEARSGCESPARRVAMGAARELSGAARHAAYAVGQAAVVAHVAAHELGAAAYAIKAARAAAPSGEGVRAGRLECRWQREQLPDAIRELVLDDQRLRNDICWSVFDC